MYQHGAGGGDEMAAVSGEAKTNIVMEGSKRRKISESGISISVNGSIRKHQTTITQINMDNNRKRSSIE